MVGVHESRRSREERGRPQMPNVPNVWQHAAAAQQMNKGAKAVPPQQQAGRPDATAPSRTSRRHPRDPADFTSALRHHRTNPSLTKHKAGPEPGGGVLDEVRDGGGRVDPAGDEVWLLRVGDCDELHMGACRGERGQHGVVAHNWVPRVGVDQNRQPGARDGPDVGANLDRGV
eukprot:scaffold16793_cov149-Isochrysis_galbana.AAC.4